MFVNPSPLAVRMLLHVHGCLLRPKSTAPKIIHGYYTVLGNVKDRYIAKKAPVVLRKSRLLELDACTVWWAYAAL